jgi:hypothetical protein
VDPAKLAKIIADALDESRAFEERIASVKLAMLECRELMRDVELLLKADRAAFWRRHSN